ncbi:hypothetical protein AMS68_004175 [Peltaster fructicola]|uniref:FAD-binding domain-containing protein n=1 Tax=Peltaster fructicola TaxID=286661 RepID=A0A6H0XVM3_9PEZI|nr:hypothetical protein AMS68_004175 [Peltaster fructicola]
MPQQHVLIIGGGISGLAIAHGLNKAGITNTIFEAEERTAYRPREWTLALHWSLPMLRCLLPDDLAARIQSSTAVDPSLDYSQYPNNTVKIVDGVSGDRLKEIPVEGDYLRVSRRKLRALCAEQLDIKYGHILQDIVYNDNGTIDAVFQNGSTHTGTIIVGADGARSTVRQHLFGDQGVPTPLGLGYLNVAFGYNNAETAVAVRRSHPVNSFVVHPDCAVLISAQDIPDPAKPEDWKFQIAMNWPAIEDNTLTNEQKHAKMQELASNLVEPYRTAVQCIPKDVDVQFSELSYWKPSIWDTHDGRVTLAGDAAHSMPPNRGQGCNHAINDALNLVQAVKAISGGAEKTRTVQSYSEEVVMRGVRETLLSKETAFKTVDYANFKDHGMMKHGLTRSPDEAHVTRGRM